MDYGGQWSRRSEGLTDHFAVCKLSQKGIMVGDCSGWFMADQHQSDSKQPATLPSIYHLVEVARIMLQQIPKRTAFHPLMPENNMHHT